jgi:Na+-transporting NADH:ubiquinone oxidoreductase subunit B
VGGPLGGFIAWQPALDAVSQATPLVQLSAGDSVPLLNLLIGSTAGSLGETSAILIIISGLVLMLQKTASWQIVVPGLIGFLGMQSILFFAGVEAAIAPHYALFAGSILFGMMYMATDPVSSSQTTNLGRWIYGAFIGILTVLIRTFSIWPEGITFAILLANMFAPILNYTIVENRKRLKAKAEGAA